MTFRHRWRQTWSARRVSPERRRCGRCGRAISGLRLRSWLATHDIPLTLVHASGHAAVADLQRLAGAIAARALFPIHAAAPERFSGRFANVTTHADGEWWTV